MHSGHRKRLRERFLKNGLDDFNQINALEFLLFFVVPQKDTNPIAHDLLSTFGTIDKVFESPFEELIKINGIGEVAATFLKLIPDISRYYLKIRESGEKYIKNTEEAGAYIIPYFLGINIEIVYVICLDTKGKVLATIKACEGSLKSAFISVREIAKMAFINNASKVIIAHNHPGGVAVPSEKDLSTTNQIYDALKLLEIKLVDHIIVADRDFVSLFQSGFLNKS